MPVRCVVQQEDEADIRDAMAALLGTWGVALTAVGTEAEAVRAMESAQANAEQFDLLIADYRLAGEANGAELGLQLRTRFDPELPLLLITGETAPDRLQKVHELGVPMMGKPIEAAALRRMLVAVSRSRNHG